MVFTTKHMSVSHSDTVGLILCGFVSSVRSPVGVEVSGKAEEGHQGS